VTVDSRPHLAAEPAPAIASPYGDRLPDWANINRCSFRRRGARGHGYAAEAVRQLMQIAAEAGVTTIHADTELDNVASQRTLHHAGFRKVDEDLELYHYETSTSHERT